MLTSAIRVARTKPELRGEIMMMRVTGTIVDGSLMLDQKRNLLDQSRVNFTLEPFDGEASTRPRDLERLTESFARYSLDIGPRTWKREDLYDR